MSIGPSTLGNLLVQRLDSALGLGQTAQHRTSAHPDALRQTQPIQRLTQGENTTARSGREAVDQAKQGDSSRIGRSETRLDQLQKYTDNRFTPSAPTTLGRTARTILALLTQYSHQPIQGQRPLFTPQQQQNPNAAQGSASGNTATTAQTARGAERTALLTQTLSPNTSSPSNVGTASTSSTTATMPNTPLNQLVQTLMQTLQSNVQQSGLFYESKLAQLVKGQTTPAALQQQPQAQLQAAPAPQSNAPTVLKQLASSALSAEAVTQNLQQSGIEPSAQQLVRQQLEVLANQVFNWRGEAWPGAPLELEIERRHENEDESDADSDAEADTPWQTRLTLQLPALGDIQARLHIHDKQVRLHIEAPDSADQLKQHLGSLVQRLEAQGLNIQQLQIVHQDDTYIAPFDPYDQNTLYD